MLFYCWSIVYVVSPTLNQHWFNVLSLQDSDPRPLHVWHEPRYITRLCQQTLPVTPMSRKPSMPRWATRPLLDQSSALWTTNLWFPLARRLGVGAAPSMCAINTDKSASNKVPHNNNISLLFSPWVPNWWCSVGEVSRCNSDTKAHHVL